MSVKDKSRKVHKGGQFCETSYLASFAIFFLLLLNASSLMEAEENQRKKNGPWLKGDVVFLLVL
jgi:hypothetical protein